MFTNFCDYVYICNIVNKKETREYTFFVRNTPLERLSDLAHATFFPDFFASILARVSMTALENNNTFNHTLIATVADILEDNAH